MNAPADDPVKRRAEDYLLDYYVNDILAMVREDEIGDLRALLAEDLLNFPGRLREHIIFDAEALGWDEKDGT